METTQDAEAAPSITGMLLVLILVAVGTALHWGAFTWPGLAMMLAATALAVWLHLRPGLRGPAPESLLTGVLVAFVAGTCLLPSGQNQTVREYAFDWFGLSWAKQDLDVYGLCIQLAAAAAVLFSFAYVVRVRERTHSIAFATLVILAATMQTLMLFSTPHPSIDVLVSQTAAGEGLLNGQNIYTMELPSPYEHMQKLDHYGYPPLNVYANCLSWFLFKEVRGLWILCVLASALLAYRLARRVNPQPEAKRFAELCALAILFLPRTLFVVEQSWTEPLTMVTMAAFALAIAAGRGPAALGVLLGLWLNSKQYVVVAIPFVVKLRPWRVRMWTVAILTTVALTLPFVLWNFPALYRALFGFFVHSMGRPDGLALYAALLWVGIELQWWVVVPLWLAGLAFFTWRMPRTLAGMLFAAASMWLFFFMFGKQAFMNYFHLISFTILLAVAASPRGESAG